MIEPLFLNAEQIANIVCISVREIPKFVTLHHLPAFQETKKGKWKARKETLMVWAVEHEKKFIKKGCQ